MLNFCKRNSITEKYNWKNIEWNRVIFWSLPCGCFNRCVRNRVKTKTKALTVLWPRGPKRLFDWFNLLNYDDFVILPEFIRTEGAIVRKLDAREMRTLYTHNFNTYSPFRIACAHLCAAVYRSRMCLRKSHTHRAELSCNIILLRDGQRDSNEPTSLAARIRNYLFTLFFCDMSLVRINQFSHYFFV